MKQFDPEKLTKARGLKSLTAASKEIGVSKQLLFHFEQGTALPSIKNLLRICECYRIKVDDLLSEKEEFFLASK